MSMWHHDVGVRLRQLRQARDEPTRGERGHRRQRQRAALALVGHHVQRVTLQPLQPARHLAAVVGASGRQHHAVARAAETAHAQNSSSAWIWRDTALWVSEQLLRGTGVAFVPGGHFKAGQGWVDGMLRRMMKRNF